MAIALLVRSAMAASSLARMTLRSARFASVRSISTRVEQSLLPRVRPNPVAITLNAVIARTLVQKAKAKPRKKVAVKKPKPKKKVVIKKKKAIKKPTPLGKPMQLPSSRGPNAYSLFVKERTFPKGQSIIERMKEIASEWRTLPQTEKDRYATLATRASQQTIQDRQRAIAALTPAQIKSENTLRAALRKKGKKNNVGPIVDPRKPKRPLSSFMLFAQEQRKSGRVSGGNIGEQGKEIGNAWHRLAQSEKSVFEGRAARLQEEYRRKMVDYS